MAQEVWWTLSVSQILRQEGTQFSLYSKTNSWINDSWYRTLKLHWWFMCYKHLLFLAEVQNRWVLWYEMISWKFCFNWSIHLKTLKQNTEGNYLQCQIVIMSLEADSDFPFCWHCDISKSYHVTSVPQLLHHKVQVLTVPWAEGCRRIKRVKYKALRIEAGTVSVRTAFTTGLGYFW